MLARKHIIFVGACYLDTILSVPHYPGEDSKLRATKLQVRRGGNCANSIEVLDQFVAASDHDVQLHLVSPLPDAESKATAQIRKSFGTDPTSKLDLSRCLFRSDQEEPASSYIIRSEATGSRTIVNYNGLAEMTLDEFARVASEFCAVTDTWWHFEGRIPDTTLMCMQYLRAELPSAEISVEVEKPGREGLAELAAEADVVFYSKTWAESRGHRTAEECLRSEKTPKAFLALCTWGAGGASALVRSGGVEQIYHSPARTPNGPITVVDSVGAGDTFIAGMLYGLVCRDERWTASQKLDFAVELATLKVQREGFANLGSDIMLKRKVGS